MTRREFIALVGGLAAWSLPARAQQSAAMRRIGILIGLSENDPEGQARIAAFRQGLQELKWTGGNNVSIDIRWGTGDAARVSANAAELISLAPDVILASNTPPARAIKQATRTIPVIFVGISDPIGDGLVTNLSKPDGNMTGFSSFDAAIAGKWLQILKEIVPDIARVTVMFNPDTAPHSIFWPALEAAAPSVGVTLIRSTIRDRAEIESTIAALAGDPVAGLLMIPDVFTAGHRALICTLVARHRVPTIYGPRIYTDAGGLMTYGPNFVEQHRQAASYIDRILKGEKPADLPVQQPTKFELVINLTTAKALGLTIPPTLLARADEVIE